MESPRAGESRQTARRREKALLEIATQAALDDYPNPNRIGCPDRSTLRTLALHRKRIPLDDPVIDHVAECSECFRECRTYRRRRAWLCAGVAGALISLAVVVLTTREANAA